MKVNKDLQGMGNTVGDAAEEQLAQVGEKASEYLEGGRDNVHGVAYACKQFIRQRPLGSALAAAGIGRLVGHFRKRD
jgi:ElaB/YqjD/DUF883 family membrane-anchored ribosome-binding protein